MSQIGMAMAAAERSELAAQIHRWPGQVTLQDHNYDCALILGRGSSLMDDDGIYAIEAITVIIPLACLSTDPVAGVMIENRATSKRYEIISVRRNSAACIIRGGIFPR